MYGEIRARTIVSGHCTGLKRGKVVSAEVAEHLRGVSLDFKADWQNSNERCWPDGDCASSS